MDIDVIINRWIDHALSGQNSGDKCDNPHHFNITYQLYMNILNITQERELSVEQTMPKVLKLLNPHVKLPSPIWNLTKKVKRFKGDLKAKISDILPQKQQTYIGEYCKVAGLKITDLQRNMERDVIKEEHITNGLFYELEQYRCKEKLPLKTALQWTLEYFPKLPNLSESVQAHSHAWKSVYGKVTTEKHKVRKKDAHNAKIVQAHITGFLAQHFIIPQARPSS